MKTEYPCDCQEWHDNYTQLERALTLAARYGYRANLESLRYCPWCSKALVRFAVALVVEKPAKAAKPKKAATKKKVTSE